jgi:hypothetical protein
LVNVPDGSGLKMMGGSYGGKQRPDQHETQLPQQRGVGTSVAAGEGETTASEEADTSVAAGGMSVVLEGEVAVAVSAAAAAMAHGSEERTVAEVGVRREGDRGLLEDTADCIGVEGLRFFQAEEDLERDSLATRF